MFRLLLFIVIMLLPISSEASYKVYLKNGSVIMGVSSYEKKNGEILIQFGGGSLGIPEKDVLKIEETEAPEKDFRIERAEESSAPSVAPSDGKGRNIAELRTELDSLNSELAALEDDEAKVKTSIAEKHGRRFSYNIYQLRRLEKELEPLQQELFAIQQRKSELTQRKAKIESDLQILEER